MPLMKTEPASICGASRRARLMSRVHSDAPRPYCELFASAIASSSSFARITAATGPNVMLPGGGDWWLGLSNHAGELDVRATLRTDDGAMILMTYVGVLDVTPEL